MSLADLAASLEVLDLGSSRDVKNPKVSSTKPDSTQAPKWKSKPRGNRRLVSPVDEFTASEPQSKLEVETSQNAEPVSLPTSPASNKKRQRPRHRKKRSVETKTQPSSSAPPAKEQEPITAYDSSKECCKSTSVYVVEVTADCEESEMVIGVYTSLLKANERATDCAKYFGIPKADIVDILSSFGCAGPKPCDTAQAKAIRRVWPNGASELRILYSRSPLRWIKVLPKEFAGSIGSTDSGSTNVYLALDRSTIGMFVIGAYRSKGEAWEACQKYSTQLSYCSPIVNNKQWFDRLGLHHASGSIGGRQHHWFVEPYIIDERDDSLIST
jgi:hypothetical protein